MKDEERGATGSDEGEEGEDYSLLTSSPVFGTKLAEESAIKVVTKEVSKATRLDTECRILWRKALA